MSIASSRLLKMLIDVSCFPRVSWTGKGANGKGSNIKFSEKLNIQKVLLEALKIMDDTYTDGDLHTDMVKILKSGGVNLHKQVVEQNNK